MTAVLPSPINLPIAVSRALRQAEAHPSVRSARVKSQTDDWTFTEIVVHTELPGAWRAAGKSPFGVRTDETVTIAFRRNFPLTAPWIVLRKDFPRFHPHIQPGKPDSSVEPCLVMGSPREVIQARGFIGLIDQLVEWLDRAASLELNDPSHGWEPVRRDQITDIIAADAQAISARVNPVGGATFLVSTYLQDSKSGMYKILVGKTEAPIAPYFGSLLTRSDTDSEIGSGVVMLAWPGSQSGTPFVSGFYLPETVENVGELFDRAAIYGCGPVLDVALTALRDTLLENPAPQSFPLTVLLLARRPYPLVGSDSCIEICPYLIEVVPGQNFLDPATPVRLAGHRDTVSAALLRRASRDEPAAPTLPWTMLGCGSVGSKIALHAARSGRAPSILVDRAGLSSHNYARHTAIPYGDVDRLFLRAKADVVTDQIEKLAQEAVAVKSDAVTLIGDEAGRAKLASDQCAMIVDTTASIVTREALAHANWTDRPRVVEACLLGAGRMGYLAREGEGANPSVSDLAAEAYRRLSLDPEAAAIAFGAQAEEVVIGQGCSAATFPMPDAELSLISAAMSGPITRWARDGLPNCGEIRIGRTDGQGGLTWAVSEELPWVVVTPSHPNAPSIRIHPRVDEAIALEVAAHPGVETGGVLVGRFSPIGNLFQIVDLIPAPPDSTRSAAEFLLGTKGLKAEARKVALKTGGALQVIGTWHNHLEPSGPSMTDAVAGAILAFRQFVPALLLIRTPIGYSSLVAEKVFEMPPAEANVEPEAEQDA